MFDLEEKKISISIKLIFFQTRKVSWNQPTAKSDFQLAVFPLIAGPLLTSSLSPPRTPPE